MSIYRQTAEGEDTHEFYLMNPTAGSGQTPYSGNFSSSQLESIRALGNPIAIAEMAWKKDQTYRITPDFAVKYEHLYGPSEMPRNNNWWTKYYQSGIDIVSDNTRPMLVHFTREQMVNNGISTSGENSDFAILTGEAYNEDEKPAYVFNDRIINRDVTCMNGYIQQLKDVLVPPGNMAQVLRADEETSIFSRMLDYFAAPYFDQVTTNNYNDWAQANGQPLRDSIFQMRYVSSRSQDGTLVIDPNGRTLGQGRYLSYDPGWNQYYPSHANVSQIDYTITDMGAMFVPDNNAVKKYFLPGGNGAFLIDIYPRH